MGTEHSAERITEREIRGLPNRAEGEKIRRSEKQKLGCCEPFFNSISSINPINLINQSTKETIKTIG
jgi:hypothetical protein